MVAIPPRRKWARCCLLQSLVVRDGKLEDGHPHNTSSPKTKSNGAAPAYAWSEVRRKRAETTSPGVSSMPGNNVFTIHVMVAIYGY
jgi:hypothetical protein